MFKRRPRWIDQFATTLSSFGVDADLHQIVELTEVAYELHADLDAAAVVRSELHQWPLPQDLSSRRDHDRGRVASQHLHCRVWPVSDFLGEAAFDRRVGLVSSGATGGCRLHAVSGNDQIAERLSRSPRTVEHHVEAILGKLNVATRGEAVVAARRRGLLPKNG